MHEKGDRGGEKGGSVSSEKEGVEIDVDA